MAIYRKTSTIQAYCACEPGVVETRWGPISYEHGDWLVTNPDGETYPVKPDVFERDYELVPYETIPSVDEPEAR